MLKIGQEEIDAVARVLLSGKLFRYGAGGSALASRSGTRSIWVYATSCFAPVARRLSPRPWPA